MSYSSIVCYHHSNCNDRPAVSTCSNCGKGLCAECTDRLRSPKTGKILCVDCLNAELRQGAALAVKAKETVKREIIGMIVGGVIGIVVMIILCVLLTDSPFFFVAFFMPTLFASFFTLFNFARRRGFFLGILVFLGGMIVSPIVFIRRLVVRIKNIKTLKEYAAFQLSAQKANQKFFEFARKMRSTKTLEAENTAKLKAEYDAKVAALSRQQNLSQAQLQQQREQYEKQMRQEHEEFLKTLSKMQEDNAKHLEELASQMKQDNLNDIASIAEESSATRTNLKAG